MRISNPIPFLLLPFLFLLHDRIERFRELSEIFQWKVKVARGLHDWNTCDKEHHKAELSEVFLYLIQLAVVCGLDLGKASVLMKLIKNARKYPVTKPPSLPVKH